MSLRRNLVLSLCLALAGCRPGAPGLGDEQKDPYFLAGKNRVQERDYQGGIDMFEKALDVNPRSASAHFELGVLYGQQQGDYPAALYHYQRAVTLKSDGLWADLARQRIQECKRELARSVTQPVSMEGLQKEADTLRAENQHLKQQLQTWQNYYAGRGLTYSNLMSGATNPPARATSTGSSSRRELTASATGSNPVLRINTPMSSPRQHVVASGETPAAIARKYGIRLSALQTANPHMDARRLRPGQTLVIPSS